MPSVISDDMSAIRRSVGYLIDTYGPRVAFLGRIKGSSSGTLRFRGYRAAPADKGVKLDPALVWDNAYRYADGNQGTATALANGKHFCAAKTASDEIALGAISAVNKCNLRIPDAIAIAGIGNMDWSVHLIQSLTVRDGDAAQMAEIVKDMFMAMGETCAALPLVTLQRQFIPKRSA